MPRVLFAATLFLAAALTFTVQPLVGKQLLPLVGGTPAVWNTCLVFFQAALLLGYLLAHALAGRERPVGRQLAAHVPLLALAGVALALGGPLRPNADLIPADAEHPAVPVLLVLAAAVGGPFLLLSTTAPLLQKWYARFGRDPYPLYAASNLGSLAGLLAFPLLVEPTLAAGVQRIGWAVGFAVCGTLVVACGLLARRVVPPSPPPSDGGPGGVDGAPSALRAVRWAALAALPSSLLASVSTHLTTDIAPMPLLWVLPLGLYLLSFVAAFGWWPPAARRVAARLTPMLLCFLAVALLVRAGEPLAAVAGVHLAAFLAAAVVCHGELAADRPGPRGLTAFYLCLAVGGVLGGAFNTFLAPLLFSAVGNAEYPLAVALAALVRPDTPVAPGGITKWDVLAPLLLAACTAALVLAVAAWVPDPPPDDPAGELVARALRGGLTFGLPAAAAFALVRRPLRFALALAAVFAVGAFAPGPHGRTLETSRNFFGTLRVTRTADGGFTRLVHGTTRHGQQRADTTPGERPEPLSYYHRRGPLGRLFDGLPADRRRRVGVVGLGAGAAAAYAGPGEAWTFYEIDPAVVRIARDERYFTYLSTCPADPAVVLGDARRQLANAADGSFDLLVLDAFSSDAVPVHLLTREAFALYRAKLAPRGVLAVHASNAYLDLAPLVARTATADDPAATARWDDDRVLTDAERAGGKSPSVWALVARREDDFPQARDGRPDPRWTPLPATPGPVWTDDFSNLLGVWRRPDPN